ncbi:MAG: iron ABC transporter substrate-binding protein [Rhodospirillales bacterium]|nr:MAG: iron ABC transporter substrate-binding protein [Rhodospirillales bacterium]
MRLTRQVFVRGIAGLALGTLMAGTAAADTLTLYSGRGETLVAPVVQQFRDETGIEVQVRYGGTAELAVLLLEEGDRTPADLFWAQDAGALGALANAGRFAELPADMAADLPDIFKSATGTWVATSGRARVLAYSTTRADSMPDSVFDLTDPVYEGRVGWAPTNGSFQAFVTAMRKTHGEDETRAWLEAMKANGAAAYRNNTALVQAIADGEIDYTITNNYYLLRFLANDPEFPVAQRFFEDGDIGNLVNVAGAGVLGTSDQQDAAVQFIRHLLSAPAQAYFTGTVYEYPVVATVAPDPRLESFDRLLEVSPDVDLDALEDLEGTLALLREVGLL